MHPVLAQRGATLLYGVVWLVISALLSLLIAVLGGGSLLEASALAPFLGILGAFLFLAAQYPCRALPLGQTPPARLAVSHGMAAIATSGLWVGLGRLWAELLQRLPALDGTAERYVRMAPFLFAIGALFYLLAAAAQYLILALDESRRVESQALELRVLAREAELRALRAQLDPHFLFNSLNSISALTGTDPAGAREMLQRLSHFLRATLALGARDRIALAEEWSLTESFLAIEQARFGRRLRVESTIDEEARACLVPPLLLQPLLENAIHHGVAQLVDGGTVSMHAACRNGMLEIEIANPLDPERRLARGSGLGLANVRDRLTAHCGEHAVLRTQSDPERFRVRLELPAERAEGGAPETSG